MGNKFKHMKQVLTAVLTVAMIFTSVPTNVLAAELESDILSDSITEVNDSQSLIEEADVLTDEPAAALIEDEEIADKSAPVSNLTDDEDLAADESGEILADREGDETPEKVWINFTRDDDEITSVTVEAGDDSTSALAFGEGDTVSANVSSNRLVSFNVATATDKPYFVYASSEENTVIPRDSENWKNKFSFTTTTASSNITLKAKAFEIEAAEGTTSQNLVFSEDGTNGTKKVGEDFYITGDTVKFEVNPSEHKTVTAVVAKIGEDNDGIVLEKEEDKYVISGNDIKDAIIAQDADVEIEVSENSLPKVTLSTDSVVTKYQYQEFEGTTPVGSPTPVTSTIDVYLQKAGNTLRLYNFETGDGYSYVTKAIVGEAPVNPLWAGSVMYFQTSGLTDDTLISFETEGYDSERISLSANSNVNITAINSSLVSAGNIYYVGTATGYQFNVALTEEAVSAGKIITAIDYQIGTTTPVSLDVHSGSGEGDYAIDSDDIATALYQDMGITVAVRTADTKQRVTFKANDKVSSIAYGTSTPYTEVDMTKARSVSGDVVMIDSNTTQKMAVSVSEGCILLTDSVKAGNGVLEPVSEGLYSLSVAEVPVNVDITAYEKATVSEASFKDGDKELAVISDVTGVTGNKTDGTAITFKTSLASGVEDGFDAVLADPLVYYANGDIVWPITPTKEGDVWTISLEDVENVIKAESEGGKIWIEAQATIPEKVDVTLKIAGYVNKISITGDALKSADEGREITSANTVVSVLKDNTKTFSIAVTTSDNDIDFIRVKAEGKGNKPIITEDEDYEDTWNVSALKGDATISVKSARLAVDDIVVVKTNETATLSSSVLPNIYTEEEIGYNYRCKKASDGAYYVTKKDEYSGTEDIGVTLSVLTTDSVNEYKFDPVTYTVAGDSATTMGLSGYSGMSYEGSVPATAIADAAFADYATEGSNKYKLLVKSTIKKTANKQKQSIQILNNVEYGYTYSTITVDGESVGDEYGYASVTYGKTAKISITSTPGYKIKTAYRVSATDIENATGKPIGYSSYSYDEIKNAVDLSSNKITKFVPGKDGAINAEIKNVKDWYFILTELEPDAGVAVTWSDSSHEETSIDKNNDGVYQASYWYAYSYIRYVNGSEALTLSDDSITVSCGDAAVGSDKWTLEDSDKTFKLNVDPDTMAGETVTVKFMNKPSGDGKVPAAEHEVKIAFTQAPTTKTISVLDGKTPLSWNNVKPIKIDLGSTKEYTIKAETGIDDGDWYVSFTGENPTAVKKNGKLIISSDPDASVVGSPKSLAFKDDNLGTTFGNLNFEFVTTQVTTASVNEVKAKAAGDSVIVDFSNVKLSDKTAKGLYWNVKVSKVSGNTTEYKTNETKKVPATATTCEIPLAINDDSFQIDEVTYKVEVFLCQEDADEHEIAHSETKTIANDLTFGGEKNLGTFATKVSVKKNKAVKKIFHNMGDLALATVTYSVGGKAEPTVKRLRLVELRTKAGEPIADSKDGTGTIREENGTIYLNPLAGELVPGTYQVKAYAMEPKGVDVVGTLKNVKIERGIEELTVTASSYIYKKSGKAASLKPSIVYNDGTKATKPAVKKATWYLVNNVDFVGVPEADDLFSMPGVTINSKNGTVKIAKGVNVGDGISFYVAAVPADFARAEGNTQTNKNNISNEIEVKSSDRVIKSIEIDGVELKNTNYKSIDLVGKEVSATGDGIEAGNVKFSTTGAVKIDEYGNIVVTKLGKASITATTTDGSKKKLKVSFTVVTGEGINGKLGYNNGEDVPHTFEPDSFDASGSWTAPDNNYSQNQYIRLDVFANDGSLLNHSIKFNGFSKVKDKSLLAGQYILKATKSVGTITITTGKGASKVSKVITIKNTAISTAQNTKVKASNIMKAVNLVKASKMSKNYGGKILRTLDYADYADYAQTSYNKVTYTVTNKGKALDSTTKGVRIFITKDYKDEDHADGVINAILVSDNKFAADPTVDGTFKTDLEAGTFTIDYQENGKLNLPAGKYGFTVTPIDADGNATGKTVSVTVQAINTPKATVSVKSTSFKKGINLSDNLVFKTQKNIVIAHDNTSSAFFGVPDDSLTTRGFNTKGKINDFHKCFTVTNDQKLAVTALPAGYTAKSGTKGYVSYTYRTMDGKYVTAWAKVTVKGTLTPIPNVH